MSLKDALRNGPKAAAKRVGVPKCEDIIASIDGVTIGLPSDPHFETVTRIEAINWLVEFTRSGARHAGMRTKELATIVGKTRNWLMAEKNRGAVDQLIKVFTKYQSTENHAKYVGLGFWAHWRFRSYAEWKKTDDWATTIGPAYLWLPNHFETPMLRGMYKKDRLTKVMSRGGNVIFPYALSEIVRKYREFEELQSPECWTLFEQDFEELLARAADDITDIKIAVAEVKEAADLRPWLADDADLLKVLKLEGRAIYLPANLTKSYQDIQESVATERTRVLLFRDRARKMGDNPHPRRLTPEGPMAGPRNYANKHGGIRV